jgi:NAD(P)-dependent dehydrogenase (short-subunit alcohol dehydrogenase family)
MSRVAVVTGAGRGIGAEIARMLCSHRCMVVAGIRRADEKQRVLDDLAVDCNAPIGRELDVGDSVSVEAFFEWVRGEHGPVDILVNNAAMTAFGELTVADPAQLTVQAWDDAIRINLSGAYYCAHHALQSMPPDGAIVNISSVHAHLPHPHTPHYDASKAGLEAATRSLAAAVAQRGIRVNAVAPGAIDVTGVAIPETERSAIPIGRAGTVREIASAVEFLLFSEAASYMTGTTILVDGGASLMSRLMAVDDQEAKPFP